MADKVTTITQFLTTYPLDPSTTNLPLYRYLITLYNRTKNNNLHNEFFEGFMLKKTIPNLIIDINDIIKTPVDPKKIIALTTFRTDKAMESILLSDIKDWYTSYSPGVDNPEDYQIILNEIPLLTEYEDPYKYIYSGKIKEDFIGLVKAFIPLLNNTLILFFPPSYWSLFTFNIIIKNLIKPNDLEIGGNILFDKIIPVRQYDFIKTMIPLKDNILYNKILEIRYDSFNYASKLFEGNQLTIFNQIFDSLTKVHRSYIKEKLQIKSPTLLEYIMTRLSNGEQLDSSSLKRYITGESSNNILRLPVKPELDYYSTEDQKRIIFEAIIKSKNFTSINKFVPSDIKDLMSQNWNDYTNPQDEMRNFDRYKLDPQITKILDVFVDQIRRRVQFSHAELNDLYVYYALYDLTDYPQAAEINAVMSKYTRSIDPNIVVGSQLLTLFSGLINFPGSEFIDTRITKYFEKLFTTRLTVVKQFLYEYTLEKIKIFESNFIKKREYKSENNTIYQYEFYCNKKNINQSVFYNNLLSIIRPYNLEHYTQFDNDKKKLYIVYKFTPIEFYLNEHLSLIFPDNALSINTATNDRLHFLCQGNDSFIHQLLNKHFEVVGYSLIIKYKNDQTSTKIFLKENDYKNLILFCEDNPVSTDPIRLEQYRLTILLFLCIRYYTGVTNDDLHLIINKIQGLDTLKRNDIINSLLKLVNYIKGIDGSIDYLLYNKPQSRTLGIHYIEIQKSFKINIKDQESKIINITSTLIWDYYIKMNLLDNTMFKTDPANFNKNQKAVIVSKEQISPLYEINQSLTDKTLTEAMIQIDIRSKFTPVELSEYEFKNNPLRDEMQLRYDIIDDDDITDFSKMDFDGIVNHLNDIIEDKLKRNLYICSDTVALKFPDKKGAANYFDISTINEHGHFIKIQSNILQYLVNIFQNNKDISNRILIEFNVEISKNKSITYKFNGGKTKFYTPIERLYNSHKNENNTFYRKEQYANIIFSSQQRDKQYTLDDLTDIQNKSDILSRFSSLYNNHFEYFFDFTNIYRLNRKNLMLTNPFENLLLQIPKCKNITDIINYKPYNVLYQPVTKEVNTGKKDSKKAKNGIYCKNIIHKLNLQDTEFIETTDYPLKAKVVSEILNKFKNDFYGNPKYKELHKYYTTHQYFFNTVPGQSKGKKKNTPIGGFPALRQFFLKAYKDSKKKKYFSPVTYMISRYFDKLYIKHICDNVKISVRFIDKKKEKNINLKEYIYTTNNIDKRHIEFELANKGNDPFLTKFPFYDIEEEIVDTLLQPEGELDVKSLVERIEARKLLIKPVFYEDINAKIDEIKISIIELHELQKKGIPSQKIDELKYNIDLNELHLDILLKKVKIKQAISYLFNDMEYDYEGVDKDQYYRDTTTKTLNDYTIFINFCSKILVSIKQLSYSNDKDSKKLLEAVEDYENNIESVELNPYVNKFKDVNDKPSHKEEDIKLDADISNLQRNLARDKSAIKENNKNTKNKDKSNKIEQTKADIDKKYKELLVLEDKYEICYNKNLINHDLQYIPDEHILVMVNELKKIIERLSVDLKSDYIDKIVYLYYNDLESANIGRLSQYYISIKRNYELKYRVINLERLLALPEQSAITNYTFDDIEFDKDLKKVKKAEKQKETKKRTKEEESDLEFAKKWKFVRHQATSSKQGEGRSVIFIYKKREEEEPKKKKKKKKKKTKEEEVIEPKKKKKKTTPKTKKKKITEEEEREIGNQTSDDEMEVDENTVMGSIWIPRGPIDIPRSIITFINKK